LFVFSRYYLTSHIHDNLSHSTITGDQDQLSCLVQQVSLLVERSDKKEKTLVMSDVSVDKRENLMQALGLQFDGAATAAGQSSSTATFPGYEWNQEKEDSSAQRTAYMKYLNDNSFKPTSDDFGLHDCTKNTSLLTVGDLLGLKLSGTSDVVVAKQNHINENAVKNNILGLFELKKTENLNSNFDRSESQAIVEHIAASFVSQRHSVLTVLTDLNDAWHFYWFAATERIILKKTADRRTARFLLQNMMSESTDAMRPQVPGGFLERGSWKSLFRDASTAADGVDDDNDADDADDDDEHKNSGADNDGDLDGGAGGDGDNQPKPASDSRTQRRQNRGGGSDSNSNLSGAVDAVSLRQLKQLLGNGDIANEVDFIDGVGGHEILCALIAKHVVPNMLSVSDEDMRDARLSKLSETSGGVGGGGGLFTSDVVGTTVHNDTDAGVKPMLLSQNAVQQHLYNGSDDDQRDDDQRDYRLIRAGLLDTKDSDKKNKKNVVPADVALSTATTPVALRVPLRRIDGNKH
jgi:hypothetical protein